MAKFDIAFKRMLAHEGGYVNDPDDRGGETYKGISRASHSNWPGWSIIDKYKGNPGFSGILDKDVALQQEINHFYWTNFWFPLNADRIQNQAMADSIFDFAVNTGIQTSIRLVQSIVEANVDGILGNETLNKLNAFDPNIFFRLSPLQKLNTTSPWSGSVPSTISIFMAGSPEPSITRNNQPTHYH